MESGFVCEVAPARYPCATAKVETVSCHRPRFTAFKVTESTNLASTMNELVASIQLDATLPANATLAITRLTGTSGPSDSPLSISSIGDQVHPTGEWLVAAGTLTFTTSKPLPARSVLVVTFTLENSGVSQPAVTPQIECVECLADPIVPIQARLSSNRVLGVTQQSPACTLPLYGSDCSLTCYGVVNGRFCDCPPGRFGDDCSQVASLDAHNSAPLTLVRAGQQAQVRAPSGAGVSIPAGATGEDVTVSASAFDVRPKLNAEQSTLEVLGGVMDMKPDGFRFAREVELALDVDLFNFELAEAKGRVVKAFFLDTTTRRWVAVGGALDRATGLVKVKTNHFSLWTVMSEPIPVVPATTAPDTTPTPVGTTEKADSGVTRIDTTLLIVICVLCGVAFLFCGVAGAMGLKCFVPPQDAAQEAEFKSEFPVIYNPASPGMGYERDLARSIDAIDSNRLPLPSSTEYPAQHSIRHRAPSPAPMQPALGQSSGPMLPPRGSSIPPLPPPKPYVQLSTPVQIFPVASNAPYSSLPPSGMNTPRGSVSGGADLLNQYHMQQLQNLTVPVLHGSAPVQMPPMYMPRGSAPPMLPTARGSRHGSFSNAELYMTPPMLPPLPPAHTSVGWPPVREKVAVFEGSAPSPRFERMYQDVPYGFPGNVGRRPAPSFQTGYGV